MKKALRMAWFGMALILLCGLSSLATAQTWSSLTPLPTGNTLNDAYSPDGGTTTYLVGDGGTILKRTGSTVAFMNSGTNAPLKGIHGRSATDIWAVGGNEATAEATDPTRSVLLHFNGATWTPTTPPTVAIWEGYYTMADVWVSSTGAAYAISRHGGPAKWNTAQNKWIFEEVTDPLGVVTQWGFQLQSIFGFSDSDIFAVGSYGTVLRRDATGWTVMAQLENGGSMSFNLLQAVWGPNADNVFTSGNYGQIYRLKRSVSTAWTQVNTGGGFLDGYDLSAMSGSGPSNIWFVGTGGSIRQWVGTNNVLVNHDDPTWKGRHTILPGASSGSYLLGGDYGLMESLNGTTGARQTLNTPAVVTANMRSVVFTDRLWLAPQWTNADIGIYAWNGGQMTAHPIASLATNSFTKTFKGFSPTDIWLSVLDTATFNAVTLRGNGSSWTAWTPPGGVGNFPPLLDVVKTVSGGYAVLQDSNGQGNPCMVGSEFMTCLEAGSASYMYLGMAASPNGDVHAVGKGGKVARWRSGAWTTSTVGSNGDDLTAVAATTNMLVAVGVNGAAFYSTNGTAWSPVGGIPRVAPPEEGYPLYTFSSIVHAGDGVFWAALNTSSRYTDGNKAYLYRIQNGVGQLIQGGFSSPINGLAASIEQNAVFAAGDNGAIWTTNPAFKEVTGAAIPPMLHLLLGQ